MLTTNQFPSPPRPQASTYYDNQYQSTLTPYVRAKYGLGNSPAMSVSQLAPPARNATLMASGGGGGISSPAPLQEGQFGRIA